VENFLFLAQVELHQTDPAQFFKDAPVLNVRPLVERVGRDKGGAAGRETDLQFDLTDACVLAKEEYCTKIVAELLDNAFKFSPRGSTIRVALALRGGSCVLKISDHGRGIKPEHIAEVGAYMQFERKFYEQQGSGLGLVITRRLAELHGGSVNISSEVGVGTTVEVRLPAAPV
jgi:signal transduction histidine kinase